MGFEIKGLDEFHRKLERFSKKAKELEGEHEIPLSELFTNLFMNDHTQFSSFEELLDAGGFKVNSQEDFRAIPDDVFNKHISATTDFNTWDEMLGKAGETYVARQLGFN